jgi:acetyl esterase/lipase
MSLSRALLFALLLAIMPGAMVLADEKLVTAEPYVEQPLPLPSMTNVVVESDIEYGKVGDRSLKLDLYLPKDPPKEPLPLIVFIHGGGWNARNKDDAQRHVPPYVATGNYIGASIGYRLAKVAKWPAQFYDCKAAIRWLRANAKQYNINPDKIGVWGVSSGGHLANLLGTTGDVKEMEGDSGTPDESTRVTCVVDCCGPSDMRTEPDGNHFKFLFGKPVEELPEVVEAASPITWVKRRTPPFLIIHGTSDPSVPLMQSERFYVALKAAGAEASLVRVEGGTHGSPLSKELEPTIAAFFDKWLRGKSVAATPKPNLREKTIIERDVEYGKVGDRTLLLDIVRPKEPAEGRLPAVVFFHGGGWNKYDKSQGIGSLVPIVATGKYFGATVGYRFTREALWPAQINDAKAAIRWLKANAEKLNIDPDKIAVWGISSGGQLAIVLATTGDMKELEGEGGSPGFSTRVAACVDYCGPSDMQRLWGGGAKFLFGGNAAEMPEAYKQASAIAWVSKDTPPTLIVHGTADDNVEPTQAGLFFDALKAAGADATMFWIEGGGHNSPLNEGMYTVVEEFLDKKLRGK